MKFIHALTITSLFLFNGLAFNVLASDLRIDDVYVYQHQSTSFSNKSRIYITNGKIEHIELAATKAKSANKIIEGNGRYVIPGLIDLHVHLASSGSSYGNEYQLLPVVNNLNSSLFLGVTGVADLFSSADIKQQVLQVNNRSDVYFAGKLFTNKNGHGTQFGVDAFVIEKNEDIAPLWQQYLAIKPQLTKAVIESFDGHGNTLTDAQLSDLGQRSKKAGLPFFVHISTLKDGKRAINAGADVLAHDVNMEPVDNEFIQLMKDNNVIYVPTLSVYHNVGKEYESQFISKQKSLLRTIHPKLQYCLFHDVQAPSLWFADMWKNLKIANENIVLLHKNNITIGAGSDAGNPYVLHGASLHHEIQALHQAGLTIGEAINAATINAGKALQNNNVGILNSGSQADLVVLNTNPLKNIEALSDIAWVFKQGKLVNREQLKQENLAAEPEGEKCHQAIVSEKMNNNIIDEFNRESSWQAFSDNIQGGTSTAKTWLIDESHSHSHNDKRKTKQRVITSQLGEGAPFGSWAGAQMSFEKAVDVSAFLGVEVTFTANKGVIFFSLYDARIQDWDHFQTMMLTTGEQQTVQIPFSQLKQFGFGNQYKWEGKAINGLNLLWRSSPQQLTNEQGVSKVATK